jgi:transposase
MTRQEARNIVYGNQEAAVDLIVYLSEAVEILQARVAELERKIALLTRDSSNSSKPPSSDGPGKKPQARPKKSRKRNPGGQPGHKGTKRELVPIEKVDHVEEVIPESCEFCHRPIESGSSRVLGNYLRCQVTDIPKIRPVITEYKLRCVECSCGATTWAQIPPQARSGFGPRFTATLAYLTALHRVTRRGCQEIAQTLFGIDISVGCVCNLHEEVSQAVESCCEKIKQALPREKVLNVDETGWKSKGKRIWLWVFVAPSLAFFSIAASRGAKVLKEALGQTFSGILCSDMFSAYNAYHKGLRQICWAHIIRNLKGLKHDCRSPDGVKFSKWMLSEIGRMFRVWYAFKEGLIDRHTLVLKTVPIRARLSRCLQTYELSGDPDVARTARGLLKHWNHLFTFLEHEGVEPTNNSAERGIRPAIQWRKICFGNQSEAGQVLTARLLTATRTCILQNKNPFEFLVDSITAHRLGLPTPSLVTASG